MKFSNWLKFQKTIHSMSLNLIDFEIIQVKNIIHNK